MFVDRRFSSNNSTGPMVIRSDRGQTVILSHQRGLLFFKTIKTASTSVEICLSRYCGPRDIITELPEADEALRRSLGGIGPQNHRKSWLEQVLGRVAGKPRADRRNAFHH